MTPLEDDLRQIEADWTATYRLIGAMGLCSFLRCIARNKRESDALAQKIDAKRKEIAAAMAGTGATAAWSYQQAACAPAFFTERELQVIYACMRWNPEVEVIGCENEEFDAILEKVHEAANLADPDEEKIDYSDIPAADEEWFKKVRLVLPKAKE